ncbi:MAG: RHS repeat-associated core domain-containing protein [Pseudomonadota bacterium]|nr:RHS repeat-associated core domain-containing protein [Pseudomonadota bacterium]
MSTIFNRTPLLFLIVFLTFSCGRTYGEINYIHTDYLGSVVAKSSVFGTVTSRYHYTPFGELEEDGELNNDPSYTSHVHDDDLKLTYMQARYYDPVIGRFYSNDPVGWTPKNPVMSFNRYLYVNNNPYKYTDPNGEFLFLAAVPLIEYTVGMAAFDALVVGAMAWGVSNSSSDSVNLADDDATKHILDGDKDGGGHGPGRGVPGKSEFPSGWTDEEVMDAVSDVATDPESKSRPARDGRTKTSGTRNGVKIDVITGNADENGKIITAWPNNVPRNPEKEQEQ